MQVEVWEELSLSRLEWCVLGAEIWDCREAISPTSAPCPGLPEGRITRLTLLPPYTIPACLPAPFRTSFSLQV